MLQYILIDGEFSGTVVGFYKDGPFIIEDTVLDLEDTEADNRKQGILEAVKFVNSTAFSPIIRYCGKNLLSKLVEV